MRADLLRTLLVADAERQRSVSRRRWLFSAVIAVANLFFAAYAERHLRDDPGHAALLLFVTIEGGALMLLSLLHVVTHTGEILKRVRTFPVDPWTLVLFPVASSLRRPLFTALAGSAAFALAVLYASGPFSALIVLLVTLFFAAGLDLLVLAAVVPSLVRPGSATGLALLLVLLAILGTVVLATGPGGVISPLPHPWIAVTGLTSAADAPLTAVGSVALLFLLALGAPGLARLLLTLGERRR